MVGDALVMTPGLGRYRLTGVLGRGAMGVVHRAYDPFVDREVAVKELVLPPDLPPHAAEDAVARFYNEARAAGRLSHPCIVTVYDVGEENGRVYLAMELLEGPTLAEVLARVGSLPPDQAEAVLTQVAEALAAAHAQGVVHRDIKPDNCFWLPDGRVKVADFGIARVGNRSSRTLTGTVLGTPGYMAPEQVRGQAATPAADVFSWGVLAYECLTGRPPFGADEPAAVMYRIVHEDPPDLTILCPDASPSLVAIIGRALAKNPAERYPDARGLVADLRAGAIPEAVAVGSSASIERYEGMLSEGLPDQDMPYADAVAMWEAESFTPVPESPVHGVGQRPRLVAAIVVGILIVLGVATVVLLVMARDARASSSLLVSTPVLKLGQALPHPIESWRRHSGDDWDDRPVAIRTGGGET
jgi:serine/threonine protein kinase